MIVLISGMSSQTDERKKRKRKKKKRKNKKSVIQKKIWTYQTCFSQLG